MYQSIFLSFRLIIYAPFFYLVLYVNNNFCSTRCCRIVNYQNSQIFDLFYFSVKFTALLFMGATITFALGSIGSSVQLHTGMFHHLLQCPMSFFDVTPVGRTLNRFSKDIDTIDNVLPQILRGFLIQLFMV